MSQRLVFWPWPDRYSGSLEAELTREGRKEIRGYGVCWDSAEWGAPALTDEGFDELYDEDESPETVRMDMFLNTARMTAWAGRVRNPFRRASEEVKARCLGNVPCEKVRALLGSGEDFDFAPDADLLKLWSEADKRGHGIDPKRPYGTGMVSRDIRALIDPDKKLSDAKFKARRLELEGQMMLMLLRFVQGAEMPYGKYARDGSWNWVLAEELYADVGEEVDYEEWVSRIWLPFFYGNRDYVQTMNAAGLLMWEGRLGGSFEQVYHSMQLGNAFDYSERGHSDVKLEEALSVGLKGFYDAKRPKGRKPLTRMMVRVLNSQGRFKEALTWMKRSDEMPDVPLGERPRGRQELTAELVFAHEAMLAQAGLEMMRQTRWLDEPQMRGTTRGVDWAFLSDLKGGRLELEGDASHLGDHMAGLAAQLYFMRGPYKPDNYD